MRLSEGSDLWDLYWSQRRQHLENRLGKRLAAVAAARLLRDGDAGHPVGMLALGCGEGHLLDLVRRICDKTGVSAEDYVGVDCRDDVLKQARRLYPAVDFVKMDYSTERIASMGKFQVVTLVNTLHEVYSSGYVPALGRISQALGKRLVKNALTNVVQLVDDEGYLIVFDGVEPPVDPETRVVIRFRNSEARNEFQLFADEYEALDVSYTVLKAPDRVAISARDFVRYITKTIFLDGALWRIERRESYQYYTETEFQTELGNLGFSISELRYLSPNLQEWKSRVVIETPGLKFPAEHILIVAKHIS